MSEAKKGSAVGKIGLLVIFVGAIGLFGYTRLDANAKSVEEQQANVINTFNTMEQAIKDPNPNGTDNTVGAWRARLGGAIQKEGGLTGPFRFIATGDLKSLATRNVLIATATLPYASIMVGKVDQAAAECKAYRDKRAATPGDYADLDKAEKRLATVEKFCAGAADKKLDPALVWNAYRISGLLPDLKDLTKDMPKDAGLEGMLPK